MVKRFVSDRANKTLGIRVHIRRFDSGDDIPDAERRVIDEKIHGAVVMDKIHGIRQCFLKLDHLLFHEFTGRVPGNGELYDFTAFMGNDEEHVEALVENRINGEEIGRVQGIDLRFEEMLPGIGFPDFAAFSEVVQNILDGALVQVNPEFQKLIADSF
jgi:hypothetical protein